MDNLDKLLDAIEHPEHFTPDELAALLADENAKELCRLISSCRALDSASSQLSQEEIDAEWQKFSSSNIGDLSSKPIPNVTSQHSTDFEAKGTKPEELPVIKRAHRFSWLFNRKIAAILFFVIASCSVIAVGVSLGIRSSRQNNASETNDIAFATPDTISNSSAQDANALPEDTVIVFEDQTLESILNQLAPIYGVKVDLSSASSKKVRLFLLWDPSITLPDLIDHLNTFERINLKLSDNTITD